MQVSFRMIKLVKDDAIKLPLVKIAGLNKREWPKICSCKLTAQKEERKTILNRIRY